MKSATRHFQKAIPRTFDKLNAVHSLRPINDELDDTDRKSAGPFLNFANSFCSPVNFPRRRPI